MAIGDDKRGQLLSNLEEFSKSHIEYDGTSRIEYVYECPVDTLDEGQCMVTQYTYDGVSNRIVNRKEYHGEWDSDWDI